MVKIVELDFGTVQVLDHLLISELKEGILFDVESNRKMLEIGAEEFKGKPYGYISNRIHSYAVDPLVYMESASYSSLKAIAVVTKNPIGIRSAEVERSFYKDKNCFEIFSSLDEAVSWIRQRLNT